MRVLFPVLGLVVALSVNLVGQNATSPGDPDVIAARAFVESMATHDFGAAVGRFDPTMRKALPEDRLATTWARLEAQVGAFKRVVAATKVPRPDVRVVVTTCEFANAAIDVQTTFNPAGEIAGLFFRPGAGAAAAPAGASTYSMPAYADATAYSESDVTVGAGTEWPLPGTLTMPAGPGPFPAIVLVHGSGPGDRDETAGPNKPFKDLALGLASRGIAVLRYDKRTRVFPAKFAAINGVTVKDETVDDVLAGVALLRVHPKIAPARVFVLGHSLGGMLIPRIAVRDRTIRGLVVMAGNTRSFDQAMLEQTQYLANLDGKITPEEQTVLNEVRKGADAVRALTPADSQDRTPVLLAPPSYWLDLRGYDPAVAAASLTQPLLVLQGERDYQVTMAEFAQWKAALAGKSSATLHSYPSLNHLFISGTGPATPEEYSKPGHVAVDVINDVASWIGSQR